MPREVLISEFKARCIAELKRVNHTGQALIVTLRGKPIARVEAIHPEKGSPVKLGSRPGRATIKKDLARIDFGKEWEMNR